MNRIVTIFAIFLALLFSGCVSEDATSSNLSLSGKLSIDSGMVIDSDTKESGNTLASNDGANDAQRIPNPSTVSGFLGIIGSEQDISDVFKLDLFASQVISLAIADPSNNDFDLYLYNSSREKVADSIGTGKIENITVATDGEYYIKVHGYSVENSSDTGGLYTLILGSKAIASTSKDRGLRLSSSYPLVDGEILFGVKKSMARASSIELIKEQMKKSGFDVNNSTDGLSGIGKIRVISTVAKKRSSSELSVEISDTLRAIKELRNENYLEYVEPNYLREAFRIPNDEFYPYQWHYPQISLPQAWDITTGSSSVIVGVIDTGVVLAHPDLQGQLVAGYDFISDPSNSVDGGGIDSNPNDVGDGSNGKASSFHGTHVAGTVAASTNNTTGVAGVAWKAKIMPLRVLGKFGSSDYDVSQAILFASRLANDSGTLPPRKADILNLSLGGPSASVTMQNAINKARAEGVIVIAAAGNDNKNADGYSPAGLNGVVTVSAVGYDSKKAPYSNFGNSVDIAAPGGDQGVDKNGDGYGDGVLSTISTDSNEMAYKFYQGTSMAAPHIAGVVALMKAVYPSLTPLDLDQLIAGSHPRTSIRITIDQGTSGKDIYYGHGVVNALKAVQAAQELAQTPVSTTPQLSVLPKSLNFSPSVNSIPITIYNSGGGTLTILSTTTTNTWLSVQQDSSANSYIVKVDRSSLTAGTHSADVVISSNGGNVNIAVTAQVSSNLNRSGGDSGVVYVILLDKDFKTVSSTTTSKSSAYRYRFDNIKSGDYYIVAGTDIDNNGYVSDLGENLGAYPILSAATLIKLDSSISNVDFTVAPQPNLSEGFSLQQDGYDQTLRADLWRIRR